MKSALETFRRLGAKAAARRAQQRLAALRERAPRTRQADKVADPHALTGRQRQVFDLLAAGLSNPEIAAELHISPKTVGHHVEAILAKLGVQNRTHAVAYALQHRAVAASGRSYAVAPAAVPSSAGALDAEQAFRFVLFPVGLAAAVQPEQPLAPQQPDHRDDVDRQRENS